MLIVTLSLAHELCFGALAFVHLLDYDTLLRLDEESRRSALTGIPQSRIESYPTHTVTAR